MMRSQPDDPGCLAGQLRQLVFHPSLGMHPEHGQGGLPRLDSRDVVGAVCLVVRVTYPVSLVLLWRLINGIR